MVDVLKYYGVYFHNESVADDQNFKEKCFVSSSKEEVHKIVKEYKSARFKCFRTIEEAIYFSLNGSASGPGNPNVVCESIPYKSLKRQEIYKFRRFIEADDFESVKILIWENPRYLIGIGDTPSIMMEGPRYNALHIAAKNNRPKIADLILYTVGDESYSQLLYGSAGDNSYIVRSEKILDLYLNTPDKVLNETPLHFAAKYGFLEVVKVFVKHPKLEFNPKNKKGQTPREITCELMNTNNKNEIIAEIHKLLDPNELFFVPMWKSSDDVERPIIGNPFSPKSPPICPLPTSPLSPTIEIKAVAGPMNQNEASRFHEAWSKSPKKLLSCGTPLTSKGILLKSPLNLEKNLEVVGRNLAKMHHVSWKEYWPFLDRFVDLRTEEGLNLLEEYLNKLIMNNTNLQINENTIEVSSPVSELCHEFSRFSISSPDVLFKEIEKDLTNTNATPFLFIENLCTSFAKDFVDLFVENFFRNVPVDQNIMMLINQISNFTVTTDGLKKKSFFEEFPFNKIHFRIALWITRNLSMIRGNNFEHMVETFYKINRIDKTEMIRYISLSSFTNVELNDIVISAVNCINNGIMKLLYQKISIKNNPKTEECCEEQWALVENCNCFQKNKNNNTTGKNKKYRRFIENSKIQVRKKIVFSDDENDADISERKKESKVTSSDNNCDNFTNPLLKGTKICDSDGNYSDSEEDFYTPSASSVSSSEDEMHSPDEGPNLNIYDNKGTSMDDAILEVISDVDIDKNKYPSIYRWKHSILLHSKTNRLKYVPIYANY